jgi:glycosyltransferase involved in cell wall biosynthesis
MTALIINNHNLPLITIVTVVFNGEKYIEKTILSVINQTYTHIEYIIIDGGSTDDTLNILNKYAHRINLLVSEKDNGIYDAMNKGIKRSSGDWINFLNAGDCILFDFNILSNYNPKITPFVYGDSEVKNEQGVLLYISGKKIQQFDLVNSMPICHQAIFYSKFFLPYYDLRYKIIADRVMTYSLMNSEFNSHYDDNIRIEYLEGGMSYRNHSLKFREEIMFLIDLNRYTLKNRCARYFSVFIKPSIYNLIRSNIYSSALYSLIKRILIK